MAKKKYQDVYLFQHDSIRRIRAYPTRMGRMWRDELGCEYPVRMVKAELTDPKDIAKYEDCERYRKKVRKAWANAKQAAGI